MNYKFLFLFLLAFLISGCNSSRYMDYESSTLNVEKAKKVLEDLTWAQHPHFRPENVLITDTFISFNNALKSTSNTQGRSASIGASTEIGDTGIHIGARGNRSSSQTITRVRDDGERVYFRPVENIRLISWKRKNRQWYVVRIFNSNRTNRNIYYTRNIDDAKLYIDSFQTMISYSQNLDSTNSSASTENIDQEVSQTTENTSRIGKYIELEKLHQLKLDGVLTETEFANEKNKILGN